MRLRGTLRCVTVQEAQHGGAAVDVIGILGEREPVARPLWLLHRDSTNYRNHYRAKSCRWIKEVPGLLLIVMVLLAVLKPS